MDKSCMELSEDWNIVPVDCEDKKKKIETEGDSSTAKVIERESDSHATGTQVQDIAEHETACGSESSLSDIEIIEDLEEKEELTKRCFISSILSSSVEKDTNTCSGESVTPSEAYSSNPSDPVEIKDKLEDSETSNCPRNDDADTDQSASPWIIFGEPLHHWITLFLEYLQNLSGFQWSCLFGLSMCLYFCIPINQANIIAMHQKENVFQMEKMFDELRNDNELLKEQILSEIKNDKLVSPFEHLIRELKTENSKLNHMLYDVKVLEKQKDSQEKLLEKKETDYQMPFKNEINKTKEHTNMLKDTKDEKSHLTKKNECNAKVKKELCAEVPIDLKLLKEWSNLIDQIIVELKLLDKDKSEETVDVNSDSEAEKDSYWSWKGFKLFINSSNVHVSELVSKCKESSEKVFLKIYKSLSSFYNSKEITQSFFEASQTEEKNLDKKSKLWNVINDLGETFVQIKKKVLDSYQKAKFSFYDYFKKSNVHQNAHDDPNMQQKIIKFIFDVLFFLLLMLPLLSLVIH